MEGEGGEGGEGVRRGGREGEGEGGGGGGEEVGGGRGREEVGGRGERRWEEGGRRGGGEEVGGGGGRRGRRRGMYICEKKRIWTELKSHLVGIPLKEHPETIDIFFRTVRAVISPKCR